MDLYCFHIFPVATYFDGKCLSSKGLSIQENLYQGLLYGSFLAVYFILIDILPNIRIQYWNRVSNRNPGFLYSDELFYYCQKEFGE